MTTRYIAAALAAAIGFASGVDAQQRCANGGVRIGDLGFNEIRGDISSHAPAGHRPLTYFESEPQIGGVRANGPAAGRLREGDVIVAIDGQLITTRAAGNRFSTIDPGDQVRLSVRRNGRVQDVTITAAARCWVPPTPPAPPRPPHAPAAPPAPPHAATPAPPAQPARPGAPPAPPAHPARPGVPPAPPRPPRETVPPAPPVPPTPPIPPAPPAPPEIMPDGWFGFGIQCNNCGVYRPQQNRPALFRFREPPTVVNVEPGTPAHQAGMRRGDRLTHVNGTSLTTEAGWRQFAAIQPNQRVRWTYTRNGRAHQSTMTALRRPDAARAPAAPGSPEAQRLRYSGTVGGAQVEVRGAPVNVSTDPRTGETIIRSADMTVRIRPQRQ
jgi:PDZ domain